MGVSIAREIKEDLVRRILDTFQDAVVWIDAESMIVEWNTSAESVFGFKRADVMGRSLMHTIIPDHHRENHSTGMKSFMATGNGPLFGHTVEIDAMTWSGASIAIAISIDQIVLNGNQYFTAHMRPLNEIPVKI
ncbi:MAG: PAS domain S-box protein [Halioglobus sp.]